MTNIFDFMTEKVGHGISLIFIKLTKNRSLKNACFGKMATVFAILVRGKNLTHG